MSPVTGLFFLVLLLNQRWSQPLRLQASHCSTFRIMCDVPSIAVFCSESIECFPGTASKFFLKLLVTIPLVPIITGTVVHFRFHIRCISMHKLLYFNSFSASFCTTFLSAGIATSISVHVFSILLLIIMSGLFAVTSLSVCTTWFHNTVITPSSYTGLGTCVYHLFFIIIIIIIYNLRSLIKQNNYTALMDSRHKRLQSVLKYIDNDKIRHHPQHRYALQSKHPNHSGASVMFGVASI